MTTHPHSFPCSLLAAAVGLALPPPATPAAEPSRYADETAPGLPSFEVRAYQDAPSSMPVSLFHNPDGEMPAATAPGGFPASCNVFLVLVKPSEPLATPRRQPRATPGARILVDTGNGLPRGALLERLRADGFAPDTITDVLLTHLHPDHIGGLFDADGNAVFPSATIHFRNVPPDGAAFAARCRAAGYDQLDAFADPAAAVLPAGFTCIAAAGHTPEHVFFRLGRFTFAGDILHAASLQLDHPEFCARWDAAPAQAIAVRTAEFARCRATPDALLCCAHAPFPGILRLAPAPERPSPSPKPSAP